MPYLQRAQESRTMPTSITSFGYKHGVPPESKVPNALVIDVRMLFRDNPWQFPALRHLRGTDRPVQQCIERTPNFADNYHILSASVRSHAGPVFLGCTGGHHRSVYLAERLGHELGVRVRHLHVQV